MVVMEVANRFPMKVRVVKTSGTSMRQHLIQIISSDISPNSVLYLSGASFECHTQRFVHYSNFSVFCLYDGVTTKYKRKKQI